MKKNLLLSFAVASAFAFVGASLAVAGEKEKERTEIGKPAPEFKLPTADGKTVSLADFKGKTVVIEWFSPYCPYSGLSSDNSYWSTGRAKKTIDAIKEADASAVYLCINSTHDGYDGKDEKTNMKDSLSAVSASPVPMLMDASGKVGHAYGAKKTPHVFIVDGAGNLAYMGAPVSEDGKKMYAAEAVKAIKDGKKPEPSETKAYGCGVKYAKKA